MLNIKYIFCILTFCYIATGCRFHLKQPPVLAPPLQQLYIKTPDPYGQLTRYLRDYLKMSHVTLVSTEQEAKTVLEILHEDVGQQLLSVSGTQQTRQYTLTYSVIFQVTNPQGLILSPSQTVTKNATLTVQSNQILASGNQTSLLYESMRKAVASDIINRLAGKEITTVVNKAAISTPITQ